MSVILRYIQLLTHLKVARVAGQPAPHKPILLLAIIEGIKNGEITENKIYITPELVARFKDLWSQLVHSPQFTPNFSLPFFHLRSGTKDKAFWHLHTKPGREIILTSSASIKSFPHLKEVIDHASFNEDLFDLLVHEASREQIRISLFQKWFPGTDKIGNAEGLYKSLTAQVLASIRPNSQQVIQDEEVAYIRGSIFKKEIPRIYNFSCSISGMRVIAAKQLQMIDACHIIPFSESGDDSVSNGLALCPNLHRAFDRGLISIDSEYRVLAAPFTEAEADYLIRPFIGRKILLPQEPKYWPDVAKLAIHRERFGFA